MQPLQQRGQENTLKKSLDRKFKQRVLSLIQRRGYRGVTLRTLKKSLGIGKDPKKAKVLQATLKTLIREGKVHPSGRKYFAATEVYKGRIQRFKEGFGFLLRDDGPDVFIPPHGMKGALDGDLVLVERIGGKRRPEGRVIQILEREIKNYIGTYRQVRKRGYVEPDLLTLPPTLPVVRGRAEPDHKVVFQLVGHGKSLKAHILEDLGHEEDPAVDIKVVLRKYNLPETFPPGLETDLPKRIRKKHLQDRLDLRKELIFTIDPKTAKDFDDAISIRRLPKGGFVLGVHIADVSHFVQEGSPLDREALERGTSVYLLDTVVPMLPHGLSGDLCSLRPGEDRLTMTALITVDARGIPRRLKLAPSVIRSKARLTYEDAQRILEGKDPEDPETTLAVDLKTLREALRTAYDLYLHLRANRVERGGLDFDLPEPVFALRPTGEVLGIEPAVRLDTHRMIEEFMILANTQVAGFLKRRGIPTIYRIHEPPKQEKIEEFLDIVESLLGRSVRPVRKVTPKLIQSILHEFEGRPEEKLVNYLLLRSLAKARYSVQPVGHFGLALKHYLHFTSPIRRYPDLMVHRIVKDVLKGRPRKDAKWIERLEKIAERSTQREIVAQDAEFEIQDLKRMEFMKGHIGEIFEGVITHVTPYGFFVEIPLYLTEGFVSVESLEGRFTYVREQRALISSWGAEYHLGQKVRVQVVKVDKFRKRMDLMLVEG